jgi:RNA-directed DNA polymerase
MSALLRTGRFSRVGRQPHAGHWGGMAPEAKVSGKAREYADGRPIMWKVEGPVRVHTASRPMYAWQDIPWCKVEREVFKLQQRIYQASCRGDVKTAHKLQRLLLKSWYAKLLATRRVTQDNRGRRTAGVDGVKSLTPPKRLHLAQTLSLSAKADPCAGSGYPSPAPRNTGL